MTDLFQVLAVNSLRGAVLILAVLVLRTLLRKTSRRVICLLWSVVALRLLLPIRLTAFFGLLPGQRTSTPIFPESTASYSQNALVSAAQITKATAGTVLSVVPRLWLVGAVLLLLWTIFRGRRVDLRPDFHALCLWPTSAPDLFAHRPAGGGPALGAGP